MSNISFKLYDPDGLLITFDLPVDPENVAADAQNWKQSMLAQGYSVTLPDKQAREERTDRAVGYMWGTAKDGRNGGRQMVCWIYTEQANFVAFTVYPEKFDLLPAAVLKSKPTSIAGAFEGDSPIKETAQGSSKWRPWGALIKKTPKIDPDGNVKKNARGYPYYDFVGVVGNEAPKPEPVAEHRQPAPATATERVARLRQAGRQQTQAISSTQEFKTWHALGNTYWGEEWDTKRQAGVVYCGKQRKPPVDLDSSSQLTMEEIAAWTASLEGLTREAIIAAAEEKLGDEEELARLILDETKNAARELQYVDGVALTHILKKLDALDPLPEDAQA